MELASSASYSDFSGFHLSIEAALAYRERYLPNAFCKYTQLRGKFPTERGLSGCSWRRHFVVLFNSHVSLVLSILEILSMPCSYLGSILFADTCFSPAWLLDFEKWYHTTAVEPGTNQTTKYWSFKVEPQRCHFESRFLAHCVLQECDIKNHPMYFCGHNH